MTQKLTANDLDDDWREIAPMLDEAMQSLKEDERTAVLMRVFEERPLVEVGKALGVSDDARASALRAPWNACVGGSSGAASVAPRRRGSCARNIRPQRQRLQV